MIAIRAIASYVPEGFEDNLAKLGKFSIDRTFLDRKIGVERVARKGKDEETSDMCVRAFRTLTKRHRVAAKNVDFMMVVTQTPDGFGLPQVSAIVHGKLGLPDECASFDLSLACSGYVYGLSVAKSFMEANGLKTGLLFTCDPYSKIIDPDDKNTALLFGDAATVTLLGEPRAGEAVWEPSGFLFTTHGRHVDAVHNKSGKFSMDGQAVVVFTMRTVPGQVRKVLDRAGLSVANVDLFVFHQGSKYIVDQLADRLGIPRDKAPIDIVRHGNTVSSSIPLMFERYLDKQSVRRAVFNGFGVGLSVGTCLVNRLNT